MELPYIVIRKKDIKPFTIYKIDDVLDIDGSYFYHLKSNDNEKLVLKLKDIKKKFN